jgi:integrase
MPREATGELRTLADGYAARITIVGRTRKDFVLTTCATEVDAEARCKALAGIAARLRRAGQTADIEQLLTMGAKARAGRPWEAVCAAVDALCAGQTREKPTAAITFGEWARQWVSGEIAKKYPDHVDPKDSVERDEQNLRIYVLPHVKDVHVDQFTLDDAEFVMASIPEVSARTKRPLRPASRRHIAQVISRLMRLAVFPGRLRKDNPIPPRWLPMVDEALAKESLYPSEDALLLGGRLVNGRHPKGHLSEVPLLRRLAYGFLAREGMRVDEMASLRWSDVDLKHGRVVLDENKTDDPRDWDLQPDVLAVLVWWKARQGDYATDDARVFAEDGVPLQALHLADLLRKDLARVGVTRAQLFERKPGVRLPIRAHDLRATFVTVNLMLGRNETWISDRTGHHSHDMIEKYRRKARTWNLGALVPFDQALPEMNGAVIDTTGEIVEDVPAPRALPPIPTRLPHGLPHASRIPDDPHFAQRKPMP